MSFRTKILTPEGSVYDALADGLIVPVADGLLGVLTGHAPMIATVAPGVLTIREAGGARYFAVGDGAAEVGPGLVSIMVEAASPAPTEGEAEEMLTGYLDQVAKPIPSAGETE